jgi:hypothetical protein
VIRKFNVERAAFSLPMGCVLGFDSDDRCYRVCIPTATDGTQVPRAILLTELPPGSGLVEAMVLNGGGKIIVSALRFHVDWVPNSQFLLDELLDSRGGYAFRPTLGP